MTYIYIHIILLYLLHFITQMLHLSVVFRPRSCMYVPDLGTGNDLDSAVPWFEKPKPITSIIPWKILEKLRSKPRLWSFLSCQVPLQQQGIMAMCATWRNSCWMWYRKNPLKNVYGSQDVLGGLLECEVCELYSALPGS